MQQHWIRGNSTCGIDAALYREVDRLRTQALLECFRSVKGVARLLLGVAVIVGPLALASLVHGIVEPTPMHHTAVAQVTP